MLDENLPTFIVNSSPHDNSKPDPTIYYTQFGNERAPAYTLKKPDPSLPGSKNRYAVALYDPFNPEVLYAEILLIPEWTQPSLSQEQIRQNGGVPPPPEPILPTEFTIQLYNPDQQVVVRQKKQGTFSSTPTWYFDMPQQTFRQPSLSVLDRTQSDPTAANTTPKISFKWKKDSKFSKDLACFLSGKTTNPDGTKKKSKEPDITVGIFQHYRELTMYEPNLQRIDMEDWKGFEVVLILSAIALRDVYFGQMTETFNIGAPPKPGTSTTSSTTNGIAAASTRPSATSSHNTRPNGPTPHSPPTIPSRIPPTDPRSQWEIDAETQRLKRQTEAEEAARKKREAAEQRQIRKMLEAEEKEKRRRQVEVDKETARLKKLYGKETAQAEARLTVPSNGAPQMPQRYSAPQIPSSSHPQHQQHQQQQHYHHQPQQQHQPTTWHPPQNAYQPYTGGPYLSAAPSQSSFFASGAVQSHAPRPTSAMAAPTPSSTHQGRLKEKKSFWNVLTSGAGNGSGSGSGAGRTRGIEDGYGNAYGNGNGQGNGQRLRSKRSSMF